jgi:DNA-binding LacI/PurR family transcriptional regulator
VSPTRRLTIKDIARSAGLSTAAVSHALRPRADSNIKLSADTIEKIRKVALELNYQPHAGARSIRSNRFHNIGYFVAKSGLMTNTPGGYLAGVHDIAEQNGFRITLIRLPVNLEEITSVIPSVFSERNLDAIVIESYSELAHQIYEQIRASRLPVIFINDRNENNSVYVDDVWGATELTEYMIGKGYGRICFLQREIEGGPPVATMHHSAADRADGYRQAMRKAKRKPEFHTVRTTGVAGLDVELRDDDWQVISQYDAVIAYDDDLANLVARAAYDRGLWIPDSLAIAGFNGDYGSLCAWQRLTTVRIPSYEMGSKAAEMAVQLIGAGLDPTLPSSAHRPTLVPGQTA